MNLKRTILATAIFGGLQQEAGTQADSGSEAVAAAASVLKNANIPHPTVSQTPFRFNFKKDKLGNKRDPVELKLPVPTVEGVIQALGDEKQQAYLLDVLAQEVYKAARMQIGDDEKPVNKQEELDLNKLSLEYLANMPKAERTGGGISKETWELFATDYIDVMPAVTGKSAEQVGNAAKLFTARFQPVKTNKPVIKFLKEQLALWFTKTSNQEDFTEVMEFLDSKADTLLAADEAQLLANL